VVQYKMDFWEQHNFDSVFVTIFQDFKRNSSSQKKTTKI
jgi:hypothetical protein